MTMTIIVIVSLEIAKKQPDEKFPFGYGKIEFLSSVIISVLMMTGVVFFIIFSFREMLFVGPEKPPQLIAILAAGISIVANQFAYKYGKCAGEKLESPAILANAMVNSIDVVSSIAVIVGVIGSNLGLAQFDHIISVLIACVILKITSEEIQKAFRGLMDFSLHADEKEIVCLANSITDVKDVGNIKTRLVGRRVWINMEISVPEDWALAKGLEITDKIRNAILNKKNNVSEVTIKLIPYERGLT
jgi:cation diffusion facilitator family transporter